MAIIIAVCYGIMAVLLCETADVVSSLFSLIAVFLFVETIIFN